MKRKYIAVMMGLVLAVAPVSAYAEETSTEAVADVSEDTASEEVSETVMGQVTEIGDDYLTISTMSTGGQGMGEAGANGASETAQGDADVVSGDASEESADAGENSDASETQTITLTDETQYLKASSSMGGMGGSAPSDAGGSAPEMPDSEAADGEVPEMPDGEAADGSVPEMPDGEASADEAPSEEGTTAPDGTDGEAMEMPDGEGQGTPPDAGNGGFSGETTTEEITLSDIEIGDTVIITLNDDGTAATVTVQSMNSSMGGGDMGGNGMGGGDMGGNGMGGSDMGGNGMGGGDMGGGMGGGQSSGVDSYDAVNTLDEDTVIDSEEITSTGTDENAVLVTNEANVTLTNDTIIRDSDDSTGGDNSSFYGVGAAVLGISGTTVISDSTISTDSDGGAGVFAYSDGIIYVMDTIIETLQDTSGGIHVAGGGTLYAWDVTATTNGTSSAAVRSDRGSGTMVVDGGTYTSNGSDSPAVYCTADIAINNAVLTANTSEAVCIEGLNTLRLYDCDLTGNMSDDSRNDNTWTVIVYQSMSGDSEVGNGTFQMVGGTLTSGNGGIFFTTNTECTITLEDVDITYADDCEFFLQCTGNTNSRGWGTTGANGSDCLFTAISQDMKGDVIWDSVSNLDFYMTSGSVLTGAIVNDETWAGNGGNGTCSVVISEDSQWIVTGDSTVTNLSSSGMITDESGNTVTIQGTDGTVYVEGTSEYTITVTSYSDSADTSGASTTDTFEDHAVERPEV